MRDVIYKSPPYFISTDLLGVPEVAHDGVVLLGRAELRIAAQRLDVFLQSSAKKKILINVVLK